MTTMTQLASHIIQSGIRFDHAANLPRPNIYWCTATTRDGHRFDTYLAADHTKTGVQKFANWCASVHLFRPTRMNSTIRLRRVLLGDIIHNPEVYEAALKLARANCESDVVADLLALPSWIRSQVGLSNGPIAVSASDALWDALAAQLEYHEAPVRVLRQAH